ncbi:MAG: RsmB/NOP family class I SAM-dependent RNA methyltransferase [Pikeienuella sp.]
MTPAARISAAIEVLDSWLAGAGRAERLLRDWGKANRYAGSKDRRAVGDIVYSCIRRQRSFDWVSGATGGRALAHGYCQAEGIPLEDIFSGQRFAPLHLSDDERTKSEQSAPDPVRLDHPDWLEQPLRDALGDEYEPAMIALGGRAPLDLRVNLLKADVAGAQAALKADGVETEAMAGCSTALRAAAGAKVLQSAAYADGLVEIQDMASQIAAELASPKDGDRVLDFCAGGGGKALALAALADCRVDAWDIAPARMKDLPERARRAGANIRVLGEAPETDGVYDLVFVDAPCSGSGTWRREPEAKWALTPERLAELCEAQRDAFSAALAHCKVGGRIVYATCSVLLAENEDQVARFAEVYPMPKPVKSMRLVPSEDATGTDGFFCQVFERQS